MSRSRQSSTGGVVLVRVFCRGCDCAFMSTEPLPLGRGRSQKRSAHGPLFPDHVRTMVFSVHLFRTFSAQKVDQRWTVQRGRPVAKRVARLPNRGVTANQGCNGPIAGADQKGPRTVRFFRTMSGQWFFRSTFFGLFLRKRWTKGGPSNVVGP